MGEQQLPPWQRASARETVGDLALVVAGVLGQLRSTTHALDALVRVFEAAPIGLSDEQRAALEHVRQAVAPMGQQNVELWSELERLLRRFAGEPDAGP